MVTVITVIGGIFALLMRFAGPIILIWLIYTFIKRYETIRAAGAAVKAAKSIGEGPWKMFQDIMITELYK